MTTAPSDVAGLAFDVGPALVGAAEMSVAHSLIWSTSELHTLAGDAGRPPMATGPWVAAYVAELFARSEAVHTLRQAGIELGQLVEMEITYHGPVHGEDRVRARCTVRSCSPPAAQERRLVLEDRCYDDDGRQVLTSVRTHRWAPAA